MTFTNAERCMCAYVVPSAECSCAEHCSNDMAHNENRKPNECYGFFSGCVPCRTHSAHEKWAKHGGALALVQCSRKKRRVDTKQRHFCAEKHTQRARHKVMPNAECGARHSGGKLLLFVALCRKPMCARWIYGESYTFGF